MGWFKKKKDPVSERSQALNEQIAFLEAQIKRLDAQLQKDSDGQPHPRLRSTAIPHGATVTHTGTSEASAPPPRPATQPAPPPPPPPPETPVFEKVDLDQLKSRIETTNARAHYNELGVRKYDLPALVQRLRGHFRGPATTNPKLVSYLAAGGIQGLRPLRYEKRVARNRFLVLVIILFLTLLGTLVVFLRHH
jgi:hypothetical protein